MTAHASRAPELMSACLTILLPLKGRDLFTLRFLWHANKARLPFRFLIADGQVRPALAALLENSHAIFPNLNIEYVRYPDDADIGDFLCKMSDALERVRTPYVMLADNDDFLAPAGIHYCVNFLKLHPEYVCCSGGIAGFSVHTTLRDPFQSLTGPFNKLNYRSAPNDRSIDLDAQSPTERVLAGLRNTWNYYAVFRTPALALIWKEVREFNPTNAQLVERFIAMRALTIGKARADQAVVSYCRQYWTSLQLHWNSAQAGVRKDFAHYLLRSNFNGDFNNVVDRISRLLAQADGGHPDELAERLRERCAVWITNMLRMEYGAFAKLRGHVRARAPWLLMWLKKRRRLAILRERRALFSKLRRDGASADYILKFRHELLEIEDVLTGREFKSFIDEQRPILEKGRADTRSLAPNAQFA